MPETAWRRLSAGDGAKGERLHDWVYLELADLDAGDYDDAFPGLWTRGLLIRRATADGDLAYFSTWCPAGTPIETLVRVEGHRWAIEDSFETIDETAKVVLKPTEIRRNVVGNQSCFWIRTDVRAFGAY